MLLITWQNFQDSIIRELASLRPGCLLNPILLINNFDFRTQQLVDRGYCRSITKD
jgi:hypothetical protein